LSEFSSGENGRVPVAATVRRAAWNVYQDTAYQIWSAQGYYQPQAGTYTLVNPVSVTLYDVGGAVLEQIQLTLSGTLTFTSVPCPLLPVPLDQSTYVRWTTYQYDAYVPSRLASTCVYHDIPASGPGSAGTNYDQTGFAYDWAGRRNMQKSPGGTITRTVFDQSDRAVCVYVGTDDTGATDLDPSGGNEPCHEVPSSTGLPTSEGACTGGANNMVLVTEYVFISAAGCTNCGGGGSEMLAGVMQHVDPDTFRLTEYLYDWRNRRQYVLADEDDQGRSTFTYLYYDNLERVIRSEQYQHTAAGAVDPTADPGTGDILIARSETSYDDRGGRTRPRPTPSIPPPARSATPWWATPGTILPATPSRSSRKAPSNSPRPPTTGWAAPQSATPATTPTKLLGPTPVTSPTTRSSNRPKRFWTRRATSFSRRSAAVTTTPPARARSPAPAARSPRPG
jgi:hypothetical protein